MTEDEAKTKWCPFVRVAMDWGEQDDPLHRFAVGFNRDCLQKSYTSDEDDGGYATCSWDAMRCIGSACMAWRWNLIPAYLAGGTADGLSDTRGYCGLAGKP